MPFLLLRSHWKNTMDGQKPDTQKTIVSLEQQLACTTDTKERLELLFQLVDFLGPREGARSHQFAIQAVQLAEQFRQPEYIARSLYHLVVAELPLARTSDSYDNLHRARAIFEELGDEVMVGKLLHLMATLHTEKGLHGEALEIYLENIKRFEVQQNTHWLLHSLVGAGMVHKQRGDFALALHYLFRAIDAAEEITSPVRYNQWMSKCCYNLAIIYAMMEDREKSLEMFLKSLQLRRENGEKTSQAGILHGLGTLLTQMKRFDEASAYLQEALDILRVFAPNKSLEIHCLVSLGMIMEEENTTEQAVEYYKQALTLNDSHAIGGDAYCMALLQLGGIYRKNREYKKAIQWLKKALSVAQKSDLHQFEYTIAKDLADVYEQLGNVGKALYYHKKYAEQKESIFGVRQQRAITTEQVKFAVSKEQAEKEKYRSEKEHLTVEVEKKKRELVKTSLQLAQKTEFLKQVKKQVRDLLHSRNGKAVLLRHLLQQIQQNVVSDQEWQVFEQQFEQSNDEFINRLAQRVPYLTPTELKVCTLLKINMNTKEIARMLSLSSRTIDYHRNNIRKKTGIESAISLPSFFAAL